MTRQRKDVVAKAKPARRSCGNTPGRITGRKYQQLRAQFKDDCRRAYKVCWLCHQPIDYDAKALHPLSFELDHYHPVSVRPDLQLVQHYWRPSHSRCNRSRAAKPAELQQEWVRPTW